MSSLSLPDILYGQDWEKFKERVKQALQEALVTSPSFTEPLTFTIHNNSVITASGQSTVLDIKSARDLYLEVRVSSISGTSPSIQFSIQPVSPDGSITYPNVYTGKVITSAPDSDVISVLGMPIGRSVVVKWTVSGTTPSFTVTSRLIAKE
jgi:hypothetical protein